jgi:mono/diheme cytochrome c family protein
MASFLLRAPIAASLVLLAAPAFAQDTGIIGTIAGPPAGTGEQIFQHICQACHMADAKGATGAATVPALAGNAHLSQASYPITMVLYGRGAMPWFSDVLTPAEIANVVGYVRTHFGNNYPQPITEADVTLIAGTKASN